MRFACLLVIASIAAAVALPIGDGDGVALLDVAKVDTVEAEKVAKLNAEEARGDAQEKKNVKDIAKMEKDESHQHNVAKELKAVQKAAKAAAKMAKGSESFEQLLGDSAPTTIMQRLAALTKSVPEKVDSDSAGQAAVLSLGEGQAKSDAEKKIDKEEAKVDANAKKAEKTISEMEKTKKKDADVKKEMKAMKKMAKAARKMAGGKKSLGEGKKENAEERKLDAEAKKVKANEKKNEKAISQMEDAIEKKAQLKKKMNAFKKSVNTAAKMSGGIVDNALGDDTPEVVMDRLQRLATEEEQNEVTKTSHAVNDFATSAEKTIASIHED